MKVRLKRPLFIKGYRFPQGWNEIPDQFKDQLPKDAVVEGATIKEEGKTVKAKPEAGEKIVKHGDRAKTYRLSPKTFTNDEYGTEIDRDTVLNAAVDDHLAKDPKNSIDTWNALPEADRKKFMEEKAAELLQPLAA